MHSEKQVHGEGNEDSEPPEVMLPAEDDGLLVMNMTVRWDVRQHSAQLEMPNPAVYVLNKGKFKYNKLIFHFIFNTAECMLSWLISFCIYCLWSGCSLCLIFSLCILQELTT